MLPGVRQRRAMRNCEQRMIVGGRNFGAALMSPCPTSALNRCGIEAFIIWLAQFQSSGIMHRASRLLARNPADGAGGGPKHLLSRRGALPMAFDSRTAALSAGP